MVHPVTQQGASQVSVYFPGEKTLWYDVDTYEIFKYGRKNIPVTFSKVFKSIFINTTFPPFYRHKIF